MTSNGEQGESGDNDAQSGGRSWKFWRLPIKRIPRTYPPIGDAHVQYPELGPLLDALDDRLIEKFVEHDQAALRAQATYRRYRLAAILGAAVTAVFGAVQASGGDAVWPGAVIAGAAALTAMFSNLQRQSRPLARYITERAKAEELRSLYFRHLSGQQKVKHRRPLERQVADIRFTDTAKRQP
jgi:hypothetical protein